MLGSLISAGASLIGGAIGNRSRESAGNKNADMQREFAQQGVRWRVADAKAAGLHPLAALGMSGMPSASPAYVGDTGQWAADAGQDIGRAINATRTKEERGDALGSFIEQKVAAQDARDLQKRHEYREDLRLQSSLLNDEVQRQYYNAQIAKLQAAPNPPMPSVSGSGGVSGPKSGAVKYTPDEVVSHRTGNPGLSAGVHPGMTEYNIGGMPVYLPSKSASEALEGAGEVGGFLFGTVPAIGATGYEWAKLYGNRVANAVRSKGARNWRSYVPFGY